MTATESNQQSKSIELIMEVPPSSAGHTKTAVRRVSPSPKQKREKSSPGKPEIILRLIKRSKGARMQELQKATGWQAHSIRAALTGLRKQGFLIDRHKNATGETVYKLITEE